MRFCGRHKKKAYHVVSLFLNMLNLLEICKILLVVVCLGNEDLLE